MDRKVPTFELLENNEKFILCKQDNNIWKHLPYLYKKKSLINYKNRIKNK